MNDRNGRPGNRVSPWILLLCLLALGEGHALAQQPGNGLPPMKQNLPGPQKNTRPEFDNLDQEQLRARLAEDNAAATKGRLWTLVCIGSLFGVIVVGALLIIGLVLVIRMSKREPRPAKSRRRREGVEPHA